MRKKKGCGGYIYNNKLIPRMMILDGLSDATLIFLLIFWKNESRPSRLTTNNTKTKRKKHLTCDLGDQLFFRCLSLIL